VGVLSFIEGRERKKHRVVQTNDMTGIIQSHNVETVSQEELLLIVEDNGSDADLDALDRLHAELAVPQHLGLEEMSPFSTSATGSKPGLLSSSSNVSSLATGACDASSTVMTSAAKD
jgi:hypothetical protein